MTVPLQAESRRAHDLSGPLPVAATPAEVREAVPAVLSAPSYRRAAEGIRGEIDALPELARALPLLERLG